MRLPSRYSAEPWIARRKGRHVTKLSEKMRHAQVGTLLGVSTLHTRRVLASYRQGEAAALADGDRGCRPSNATSDRIIAEVVHPANNIAAQTLVAVPASERAVRPLLTAGRYRRSLFLMNAVASSTSMRPMGPDAYMEPRTIPRRNRNSVGCT